MTTIIATKQGIYSDTLCSYTVPFKVSKIAKIGKSVYAGAGAADDLHRFFDWVRSGGGDDVPAFEEAIDILECAPDGIFLYGKKFVRLRLEEEIYSIGSGCQYAMGALAMGATPEQAMEVAARLDPQTALPMEYVKLRGK